MANALKFPVQNGFDGTGFTVAIINNSAAAPGDVAQYLSYFQTPPTNRTITAVSIDAASLTAGGNGGTANEMTLDVETVAGLAPGANILEYVTPSLDTQGFNDALNQIVTDARANVVSYSAGGCENGTSAATSAIVARAAKSGVALVVSSGDQGSACFNSTTANGQSVYASGVSYPASDPNAIGVGGTETNRTLLSLTAWNDTLSAGGAQGASGGGVSTLFGLPAYQSGLAGASSTTNRNVPDIAMPAVYAAVYLNGRWQGMLGTSWSAPQFSAMLAEVYQYCKTAYNGASGIPYSVVSKAGYTAFQDITSGNNGYALSNGSTPAYPAQTGYDNVTGIGEPLGMPFAQALCPNRIPSSLARTALSNIATRSRSAAAYSVDVRPTARNLQDAGRRSTTDATRIQLVLLDSPTIATDERVVIDILNAAGLTIVQTFRNHLVVDAQGGAGQIERLFLTRIHNVAQGPYGITYAPVSGATIPASLAPYVAGISLDNVVNMANPR